MAEEQAVNLLSAVFPPPPPFYQYFTPDNLAALAAARDGDADSPNASMQEADRSGARLTLSDVSSDLRYLVPPEPPSGAYRSFGGVYDINAPLPNLREMGIEQLYVTPPSSPPTQSQESASGSIEEARPPLDRSRELTILARSLLLNFLELASLLANDPGSAAAKLDDLRTLFLNAHHLVNEYRPYQAREALIALLEERVRRGREEVEGVQVMADKVDALLKSMGEDLEEGVDQVGQQSGKTGAESVTQLNDVWRVLDEIEV